MGACRYVNFLFFFILFIRHAQKRHPIHHTKYFDKIRHVLSHHTAVEKWVQFADLVFSFPLDMFSTINKKSKNKKTHVKYYLQFKIFQTVTIFLPASPFLFDVLISTRKNLVYSFLEKRKGREISTSLSNFLPHSTTGTFSTANAVNTAEVRAPKNPITVINTENQIRKYYVIEIWKIDEKAISKAKTYQLDDCELIYHSQWKQQVVYLSMILLIQRTGRSGKSHTCTSPYQTNPKHIALIAPPHPPPLLL